MPPISLKHSPTSGEDQRLRFVSCPSWPVFLNDSTASVEDACQQQPLPLGRSVLKPGTFAEYNKLIKELAKNVWR